MQTESRRLPLFTFPVLAILLVGSGCTTLPMMNKSDADAAKVEQGPQYIVEILDENHRGETKKLPLTEGATVQTAIEASRANRKFSRFHVAVSRLPAYPGAPPQKLVSGYDHVGKQVPMEYDYSLRPGDRVVILKDTSNSMDDMFGSVLNPLRMMGGNETVGANPLQYD
ncbi:hypothetical protein LOC68_24810 [Blastopirellula sp. JC732]|uniref:Uncharacterized protein n=1 Tax=Blastopirellula sediminis TaxID=2894196 RepID=A0A9X1SJ85_9BACT|nr:hypothetical protein [Blastopirellula sediminis]MCC9605069.1 hypothetical protein [Blastopirellula sediminis]MCC9631631.1 hypothetical protein [Blastopirellula sediminis]